MIDAWSVVIVHLRRYSNDHSVSWNRTSRWCITAWLHPRTGWWKTQLLGIGWSKSTTSYALRWKRQGSWMTFRASWFEAFAITRIHIKTMHGKGTRPSRRRCMPKIFLIVSQKKILPAHKRQLQGWVSRLQIPTMFTCKRSGSGRWCRDFTTITEMYGSRETVSWVIIKYMLDYK